MCAPVNAWRWHSHNLHLEPGACAYVIIWRWCNNLHLQLCMCAHVHAWRWHSDTATIFILNCVCVLMSMLISTLKHVLMSMLGGGIATISILNHECVCAMSCLEWYSHNLHLETCVCVCLLMSMLGGEEWEDLLGYKRKAYIHYNSNVF